MPLPYKIAFVAERKEGEVTETAQRGEWRKSGEQKNYSRCWTGSWLVAWICLGPSVGSPSGMPARNAIPALHSHPCPPRSIITELSDANSTNMSAGLALGLPENPPAVLCADTKHTHRPSERRTLRWFQGKKKKKEKDGGGCLFSFLFLNFLCFPKPFVLFQRVCPSLIWWAFNCNTFLLCDIWTLLQHSTGWNHIPDSFCKFSADFYECLVVH